MNSPIVQAASLHVSELLALRLPDTCSYHNPAHTAEVAAACLEIGHALGLQAAELEVLQLAAWFHDTGYVDVYDGHEQVSAGFAREYLLAHAYPEPDAARVAGLILATWYPHRPDSLMEEVIRDADLVYVGREHYIRQSDALRLEWKMMLGRVYTDDEWLDSNIEFLQEHSFRTPYARSRYGAVHQRNLQNLLTIRQSRG